VVNKKRTRRLWTRGGLEASIADAEKAPCRVGTDQRQPVRPDQVWALDYQSDVTAEGRQVRFLNVIDEFTREALAARAARLWNSDDTVALLDELITRLGRRPEHVRMAGGPELTAYALRDWARFTGTGTA
jgi:hypothetical protein